MDKFIIEEKPKTNQKTKGKPAEADIYAGKRLRHRRCLIGLSQQQVAKALGLTFQQIQKYECGTNRMATSRLLQLTQVLNVRFEYFIEGFEDYQTIAHQSGDDTLLSQTDWRMVQHYLKLKKTYPNMPRITHQFFKLWAQKEESDE